MAEFDAFASDYVKYANTDVPDLGESVEDIVGVEYDDLLRFSSQECFAKSYKVSGYAMYIQARINENKARINWCNDVINMILAKEWHKFRDSFMTNEVKKQAVLLQSEFGNRVSILESRLKCRLALLNDKLIDIRRMSDTLFELGKRKAYNERS